MTLETDTGALTPDRLAYQRRLDAMLRGEPFCGNPGPEHAVCVLPPYHSGDWHEGNGWDRWGPKYRCWRSRSGVDDG